MSKLILQQCSCKDFKEKDSITFDSQDFRESRTTKCPYCNKKFHVFRDWRTLLNRHPNLKRYDRVCEIDDYKQFLKGMRDIFEGFIRNVKSQ